jgi:hypothetical protein
MRYPQLIVCDRGRGLGLPLRELARQHEWIYRLRQQPSSCLRLLRPGYPTVLVLRLGTCLTDRSLERELRLLEWVARLDSDTRAVVINETESPALAALAWDLGAAYVLSAVPARGQLEDLVGGLMKSAVDSHCIASTGR